MTMTTLCVCIIYTRETTVKHYEGISLASALVARENWTLGRPNLCTHILRASGKRRKRRSQQQPISTRMCEWICGIICCANLISHVKAFCCCWFSFVFFFSLLFCALYVMLQAFVTSCGRFLQKPKPVWKISWKSSLELLSLLLLSLTLGYVLAARARQLNKASRDYTNDWVISNYALVCLALNTASRVYCTMQFLHRQQ